MEIRGECEQQKGRDRARTNPRFYTEKVDGVGSRYATSLPATRALTGQARQARVRRNLNGANEMHGSQLSGMKSAEYCLKAYNNFGIWAPRHTSLLSASVTSSRTPARSNSRTPCTSSHDSVEGIPLMVKHQCGTCVFFQASGNPKHGWCTHPERREATSMRILVRAGELRCRNDWGQDLWTLRDPDDQVLEVVMANDISREGSEGTAARRIPPPIDRVIAPSSDPMVAANGGERTSLVSDDINRELLRRAQERFRDRQARTSYSITGQQASAPAPESEADDALVISNDVIPPTAETHTRAVRDDILVVEPKGSQSSLPEVFVPAVEAESRAIPSADEPAAWQYNVSNPWRVASGVDEKPAEDPLPAFAAEPELPDIAWDEPVTRPRTSGRYLEQDDTDSFAPMYAEAQSDEYQESDEAIGWEPALPQATYADALTGSVGASPDHVWAQLPRCCGTCKDFRPASDERRGWCTNQWAFKHRRMVDANDRPCETSIGHWWVAADFAWQGELDMSSFSRSTPLMDKFLGTDEHEDYDQTALIRRRPS